MGGLSGYAANQGGQPVPGSDVFRMPGGEYSPMTPQQIFAKTILSFLASPTGAPGAAKQSDDYNTRLKNELDKLQ